MSRQFDLFKSATASDNETTLKLLGTLVNDLINTPANDTKLGEAALIRNQIVNCINSLPNHNNYAPLLNAVKLNFELRLKLRENSHSADTKLKLNTNIADLRRIAAFTLLTHSARKIDESLAVKKIG